MAVQMKYPCKRFSTLARVGGAGFRQLSTIQYKRKAHFDRVYAMYRRPWSRFVILARQRLSTESIPTGLD